MSLLRALPLFALLALIGPACSDDPEADRLGVGAECTSVDDCVEEADECLDFKGGYCGLSGCTSDADCPEVSACVTHDDDGINYCFRLCVDKPECNANRTVENESNCVGSATFVDGANGRKACIPPSGS